MIWLFMRRLKRGDKLKSFLKCTKILAKQPWLSLWIYLILALGFAVWFYFERTNIKGLETFFDSIYFSFITITTLGYGDMLPDSKITKFYVILESIFGVFVLGFFLIYVSLEVANKKERKRIETQKLSFKEQYKIWFENTIDALWHLCNENLSYEERSQLSDNKKVRDYFKKNESQQWNIVADNLIDDSYHRKEILHELEFLQRNIETLIMHVPIDNIAALNRLNNYIHLLYKMRKLDLNDYEERKVFIRRLWQLITLWDVVSASYEKDYLLDIVNSL